MSKWNKPNKPDLSEEFIQNEERRKQMIIEAAKRRRQKQRKLQQLNEQMKKKQQKALQRHKQQKKDAYVKYLRNNMHDKYEQVKQKQKLQSQVVKDVSKWKRKNKQENNSLEGLGLQINLPSKVEQPKTKYSEKKKMLIDQFQKQWTEQVEVEELIGSKLIDSLDLDIATVERGYQYNKAIKQRKKDQDDEVSQVRDLIGYESILFSIDERKQFTKRQPVNQVIEKEKKQKNQQEAFNELKNKKQGKLLNWANQQVQEADDLFSNCSSKRAKTLKLLNEDLKKERLKKILQPIPQKKQSTSTKKKINNSQNKNPNQGRKQSTEKNTVQKKAVNKTYDPSRNERNSQEKKAIPRIRQANSHSRQKSKEKSETNLKKKQYEKPTLPKTQQPFSKKVNPPVPQPTYTVATHEQHFQVESFIKNDLMNLNVQERKLQQQIRQIHLMNKEHIKDIQQKHQIKTDYKSTKNLINYQQGIENQSYRYKPATEDEIEDSIQKLDDLLIKREIDSRERPPTHITEESYSLLGSEASIIDPFSKPSDFQNQILQLAENISRFQTEEKVTENGYAQKNKMKKKKNHIPQQIVSESKNYEELSSRYKRQPSLASNMPKPPILQYSTKNQQIQCKNQQQFQDSLDTMAKERVQVNQKLKNLLFD